MLRTSLIAAVCLAPFTTQAEDQPTDTAKKVEVARVLGMWVSRGTDASSGFQFVVTLRNKNEHAVRVTSLRVRWTRRATPIDPSTVDLSPAVELLPGQEKIFTCHADQTDAPDITKYTKYNLEVAEADRLSGERLARFRQLEEDRKKLKLRAQSKVDTGMPYGVIKLTNPSGDNIEGLHVLVYSYSWKTKRLRSVTTFWMPALEAGESLNGTVNRRTPDGSAKHPSDITHVNLDVRMLVDLYDSLSLGFPPEKRMYKAHVIAVGAEKLRPVPELPETDIRPIN